MSSFIVGMDMGGTFTDAISIDQAGKISLFKAATTPKDFSVGVINALRGLASQAEMEMREFLRSVTVLLYGTTLTTNIMVSKTGSKVGIITTKGHRDVLSIMGGTRGKIAGVSDSEIMHSGLLDKPVPLVPKQLIQEVSERVDYKGAEIVALNEEEVAKAVHKLIKDGVESIAVCFLWSFKNPAHERKVKNIIKDIAPELHVTVASEICPKLGEHLRLSSAVIDAYCTPALTIGLKILVKQLADLGLRHPPLIMQSSGGVVPQEVAVETGLLTIGSGPVGGVVGAISLGSILGYDNVICADMGGTSFDVGVIEKGRSVTTTIAVADRYPYYAPMVDVTSIGSGGGSIAWIDDTGTLKVGPKSAGADPGPACYDHGGTEATVTDADLVLGHLDCDYFLGGRMKLNKDKAIRAIQEKIAEPLGLSVMKAAEGIVTITNSQMADLIRKKTIECGHDPREFVVFAYGGAGPVHGSGFARELGIKSLIIPLGDMASGFSAFGVLTSDVKHVFEITHPMTAPFDKSEVNKVFSELKMKARTQLDQDGISEEAMRFQRFADMKFSGQIHEVEIEVEDGVLDESQLQDLCGRFESRYDELFGKGAAFREAGIEIVNVRLIGIGESKRIPLERFSGENTEMKNIAIPDKARKARGQVLWPGIGSVESDIYDGTKLIPGNQIRGPALIQLPDTTALLYPGDTSFISRYGTIVINCSK